MSILLSMFGPYRRVTPELAAEFAYSIHAIKKNGEPGKYADRLAKTEEAAREECARLEGLNPGKKWRHFPTR